MPDKIQRDGHNAFNNFVYDSTDVSTLILCWLLSRYKLKGKISFIFMLLLRLQLFFYSLACAAVVNDESKALKLISQTAHSGQSVREVVTPEEMEKWIKQQW